MLKREGRGEEREREVRGTGGERLTLLGYWRADGGEKWALQPPIGRNPGRRVSGGLPGGWCGEGGVAGGGGKWVHRAGLPSVFTPSLPTLPSASRPPRSLGTPLALSTALCLAYGLC